MQPGTTQEYEFNKALVLSLIRDADGIDTRQLIDKSELRENTVKRACSELKAAGRILGQFEERTPGLRFMHYYLNDASGRAEAMKRAQAYDDELARCRRAADKTYRQTARQKYRLQRDLAGLPPRSRQPRGVRHDYDRVRLTAQIVQAVAMSELRPTYEEIADRVKAAPDVVRKELDALVKHGQLDFETKSWQRADGLRVIRRFYFVP